MRTIRTTIMLCLIFVSLTTATVITVDNRIPSIGDYNDIVAAHDAASDGDTLLVYPSMTGYSSLTVTKQLHILGPGHREVSEYSSKETATIGQMIFEEGSAGSVFEGFKLYNDLLYVHTSDVIIRNNILRYTLDNPYKTFCLEIGKPDTAIANVLIQGNKIIGFNYDAGGGLYNSGVISINNAQNTIILTNIIINTRISNDLSGVCFYNASGDSYVHFINNVIHAFSGNEGYPIANIGNNIVVAYNNIFYSNTIDYEYSSFYANNIFNISCNPDYILEENNNICNVDISTVFVDRENYDFRLAEDSPAIGSGVDSVDMGIYGGNEAYIDGGFPNLPAILDLNSDVIVGPGGGLNIEFKAKGN